MKLNTLTDCCNSCGPVYNKYFISAFATLNLFLTLTPRPNPIPTGSFTCLVMVCLFWTSWLVVNFWIANQIDWKKQCIICNWSLPGLFFFSFFFSTQLTEFRYFMTGSEPLTSGVGSDHSTNWVATNAHHSVNLLCMGTGRAYWAISKVWICKIDHVLMNTHWYEWANYEIKYWRINFRFSAFDENGFDRKQRAELSRGPVLKV